MRNRYKTGDYFHVFNKSIAGYSIFNSKENNVRFLKILNFYNSKLRKESFSKTLRDNSSIISHELLHDEGLYIKYIAYCLMPSHYHLLIKIIDDDKISKYMNDVENSYVRFFNLKHNRKGPLWQSAFKAVRIKNNEQLLHVSRYIHLNPSTSFLVDNPYNWEYSSLKSYLNFDTFAKIKDISIRNPEEYRNFICNRIDYQQKLRKIKKLIIE